MSDRKKDAVDEAINTADDGCQSLETIFSGIRHEIGNPVNSIKITASVLKENLDTYPKEKVLKYVDRVLMEVERIETLLRSLKNFTLYDDLLINEVRLPDFFKKFLVQLEDELKERGITVRNHIQPEVGLFPLDLRALNQVFLNIMSNAMDALEEIENPVIIIDVMKIAAGIRIAITDNGHGVPMGLYMDIFKPFFSTRTRRMGLGLSIAQRILTNMGGTIRLEGGENTGTAVIIQIPGEPHDSS
jgi:signal transduction histidine kinase